MIGIAGGSSYACSWSNCERASRHVHQWDITVNRGVQSRKIEGETNGLVLQARNVQLELCRFIDAPAGARRGGCRQRKTWQQSPQRISRAGAEGSLWSE